jgi:hypothetical protein
MVHRCSPVAITAATLAGCAGFAQAQSFLEGFNTLPPAGWFLRNNSDLAAGDAWFQGNSGGTFASQAGDPNSYAGSNYARTSSGAATGATISCWMLTHPVTMANGDALSFYTRSVSGSEGGSYADRMQVRMSTTGASTNVGTAAFDVGDFTTLMRDINPT